jgi:hypothetical protein
MTDAMPATGVRTVLLVHGAFADGSGWAGVIERLQAVGIGARPCQSTARADRRLCLRHQRPTSPARSSRPPARYWPSATPPAAQ